MRAKAKFYFQTVEKEEIPDGFLPWLSDLAMEHKKSISINYIFCSDDELLEINQKHLNHNYYTDIITFDLSTLPNRIESDIYVSIDRVKDNAEKECSSFVSEFSRVLSHGVFHLLGFGDKKPREVLIMRELEQNAINKILNVSRET